jgi:DNA modification methylase
MPITKLHQVIPIGSIKPFAKNPRHHSRHQIALLADSIRDAGVTNPLLIDEHNELIAGHGRLLAAQKLGMATIDVFRIIGLSAAQKRRLRIADNKLAELSTWDLSLLAEQLELVVQDDCDVTLTGFSEPEIEKLLTAPPSDAANEPPLPPIPENPVSRIGDLWALGDHRILCADARDPASFALVLDGALADQVITDVPYNVPISGNVSGAGQHKHGEFAMASGEMSKAEFTDFLALTLGHARSACRDGALVYVFIDWRSVADLVMTGRKLFTELKNIIAWVKPNGAMGSLYRSQHELIVVFKHGHAKHHNNVRLGRFGRNRSNVWQYPGASGFSKSRNSDLRDHPTVKPVQLVADAIRDASMPGEVVFDPFGGAGTTLIAAHEVGRRAALIEIEPRFVDVTLRRFQELSGIEPLLLPDRTPLSAILAARLQRKEEPAHV